MVNLVEAGHKEAKGTTPMKTPCASCASSWLWLVERRIVRQAQHRLSNRGEDLIVVIVTNVKREISIDAFQRARPDQATRATRANALLDRVFRKMFDDMTRTAAGNLRFKIAA